MPFSTYYILIANFTTLQPYNITTILPSQGLLKETLRPRAGNYGVTCGPGFSLIRHRH